MDDRLQARPLPALRCALAIGLALAVAGAPLAAARNRSATIQISTTAPLPDLLQAASNAFAAGDYGTAATQFAQIETEYGAEEAWKNGTLPQRILPLKGFAELQRGATDAAVQSLEMFLERFPNDAGQRSFVLYALALALRKAGDHEAALERFATYETENAHSPQAALAALQRAEILFELDRPDAALAALDTLQRDGPTESLRTQARLRALQKATDLKRDAEAAALLLQAPWSIDTMPEIAVLAFSAMEIGDRMLAAGEPSEALRCYRLVLPKHELLEAQRERVAELKRVFAERAEAVAAGGGAFWVEFYRARILRLDGELQALEASEDFTAPLRLRVGQAFLLAQRPREAWLAFEALACDEAVSEELRREAHYRWILAAAELPSWDEALAIAREFAVRFPGAAETPEVFHLIARAHLEQQRLAEAESVLGDILALFPDAPAAGRACFTRGWVRAMQERFEDARADFDRYAADFPDGPLLVNARLWQALTWFFERRYDVALSDFDRLLAAAEAHPMRGEVEYRRSATLYAMREYEQAQAAMEAFLRDHPDHPRAPEALVLLGDILMGAGKLDEARARFAQIDPAHLNSYVYGVFQTGKILRAEGKLVDMADHFRGYADRQDLPVHPRISEALYWVGWAEEQRGDPAAAFPIFQRVLDRFGNDPAAGEIDSTLRALQKLATRLRSEAPEAGIPDIHPLLAGDFDAWLVAERERALAAGELTRHARLTLFTADRHLARKEPYQAEALVLEVASRAPVEALDAPALARVGLTLQEVGSPDCIRYFHQLLAVHPASMERASAYHGLAVEAARERRTADALRWIARFESETPTHPLAPRTALLAATTLEQAEEFEAAAERFESVLRLRSGRGRVHAEALMGLARCATGQGDARRAVSYCQRVYNLHRAQKDLAADAYLRSGHLFAALGDVAAAAATYREMLSLPEVGDSSQRSRARQALETIEQPREDKAPEPVSAPAGPA